MFFENTSMPNLKTLPENLPCHISSYVQPYNCFGKTSSRHLGKKPGSELLLRYTVETDM
jgi:hypothetical protein